MTGYRFQAVLGESGRQKAMVISHERSGTHFLMNTLAKNFGYVSNPWFNFDFDTGLNFHSPKNLSAFFRQLRGKPVLNVVKSHHEAAFFRPLLDELLEDFHIFYVYRDPRDALVSFWRLVCSLSWEEGPRTETPGQFMRQEPSGAMLRYQKRQAESILHRWKRHVKGWTQDLPERTAARIRYVRYEDLNLQFEDTVRQISERTGLVCPRRMVRPDPACNVILSGKGQVGDHLRMFSEEDLAWIWRHAGEFMKTLGYRRNPLGKQRL